MNENEADLSDAERLYRRGNKEFGSNNFEEASVSYSQGLQCSPGDELRLKMLLNRSMCGLKLRNYESVIKDCCVVLESDPNNIKALIRRATAYEYIGEFNAGLRDSKLACSLPGVPATLHKSSIELHQRLLKYHRSDTAVQREAEGQAPASFVTSSQCLRLSILEHNLQSGDESCGSASNYGVRIDLADNTCTVRFRLCIGNEFGLWNKQYMSNCEVCRKESSGSRSSNVDGDEGECGHGPLLRCSPVVLWSCASEREHPEPIVITHIPDSHSGGGIEGPRINVHGKVLLISWSIYFSCQYVIFCYRYRRRILPRR